MKTELINVLVTKDRNLVDNVSCSDKEADDSLQFDEMLDYAVEELGVDPDQIINRMKWHKKQNKGAKNGSN